MRILSIGHPLAHRQIDNHTVFDSPAWSEYDAVVVDPSGVFKAVREVIDGGSATTFGGMPVVNGASTTDHLGIADLLRRRRDEAARLLERGGLIAVFGAPPGTLPEVAGFGGADRYCVLPAPAGLAWDVPLARWAEGRSAAITDHAHPFASYVDAIRDEVQYRAVLDDRAPGFATAGRVFARTGGGEPVGVEFTVLGGRVIFLPAPAPNGGTALAEGTAIEAAARELLGRPDPDDSEPYWLSDLEVPGLAPLLETATNARELATRSEERATAAEHDARQLARVREVLWREGQYALLPAAVRCCELLGFKTWDEAQPTLHSDEGTLYLEVEGARAEVGMAPHYRMRARLDATIADEQRRARGLVVANGQRTERIEARTAIYLDALAIASTASGYALLPAAELFAAARAALGGADEATLAAFRRRLFETDGPVALADLIEG